jgi:hypothetical protein
LKKKSSSHGVGGASETDGHGAPNNDRAIRAAHDLTAAAMRRVKVFRTGGWVAWLSSVLGEDQIWNIMAFLLGGLFFLLLIALIGAIILRDVSFFTQAATFVGSILAPVIAFVIGRQTAKSD